MSWMVLVGAIVVVGVVLAITRKIIRALVTGLIFLVVGVAVVAWLLSQGIIAL